MSWTQERARVAGLSRDRKHDDPDLVSARLALRAARLDVAIEKIVSTAPPLSQAQRDRLATLLRPSAGGGPHAA